MSKRVVGQIGLPPGAERSVLHLVPIAFACLLLAYVAASADLMWLVAATFLGGLIGVLARKRHVILALTAITVVLGSSSNAALSAAVFYPRFAMYGALIGANLMLANHRRPWRPQERWFYLLSAFLVGLGGVSTAWSVEPSLTAARAFSLALLLFAVATTVLFHWKTRYGSFNDLKVLAVVGAGMLSFSLIALAYGSGGLYQPDGRFRGLLQNPNTIGVLGSLSLPLLLVWSSISERAERLVARGAVAVVIVALLVSKSRGGLSAAAVTILVFLWLRPRGKARTAGLVLACISVIAMSIALLYPDVAPRQLAGIVERFQGGERAAAGGRLEAWRLAGSVWSERPISGWGFGTTERTFGSRVVEIEQVFQGSHPHNGFLDLLLELGPVGPALMVSLLAIMAVSIARSPRDDLRAGVAASLAGAVTLMFVESGFTSAGSIFGFMFWFLAAAALRLRYPADAPAPDRRISQPSLNLG